MSRFHIIGWTTVACALGTAALLFRAGEPDGGQPAPAGKTSAAPARPAVIAPPRAGGARPARQAGRNADAAGFAVTVAKGSPPELAAAAEWVHAASRERLDELTERYRLTAAQRERVFPLIAQHIPGYSPAMLIRSGGAGVLRDAGGFDFGNPDQLPGRSFEDELFAMLDPQQQARMADEALDGVLWWQEIAAQLEAELDAAITGAAPAAARPDEPAPPAAPDIDLFDLFGN